MAMFSSASIYYTICFEILETTTLNTLEGNCKFTTAMINSIISPSLTTRPLWNKQPILFSFFSYFVECCRLSNIIHTLLCSISITLRTKRLKRKKMVLFFILRPVEYSMMQTRCCQFEISCCVLGLCCRFFDEIQMKREKKRIMF